jgi:hypothetical protein
MERASVQRSSRSDNSQVAVAVSTQITVHSPQRTLRNSQHTSHTTQRWGWLPTTQHTVHIAQHLEGWVGIELQHDVGLVVVVDLVALQQARALLHDRDALCRAVVDAVAGHRGTRPVSDAHIGRGVGINLDKRERERERERKRREGEEERNREEIGEKIDRP